jgi:hypothetical protein
MEGRGRPGPRRHAMRILRKIVTAMVAVVLTIPVNLWELSGQMTNVIATLGIEATGRSK